MYDLQATSKAFKDVEMELKKTLPTATVKKVQVLQNFQLWKKYQYESLILTDKLKREAERHYLWHGTNKTDPKVIYEGDVGWDMTFASVGMWGRAIYFAVNSSYSDAGYKFVNA